MADGDSNGRLVPVDPWHSVPVEYLERLGREGQYEPPKSLADIFTPGWKQLDNLRQLPGRKISNGREQRPPSERDRNLQLTKTKQVKQLPKIIRITKRQVRLQRVRMREWFKNNMS